jgi:NAD(P)H-hydrate epimerase
LTSTSRAGDGHGFPAARASSIPAVSAEQMREVDRVAIQGYEVLLIQMMENAGSHLADLAVRRFGPEAVEVLCGTGGNGGGGLVAARHLANRGVRVHVSLSEDPDRLGDVMGHQLSILRRMGLDIGREPTSSDLVIDALLGYSLRGDPRGGAAALIRWANDQGTPVCALDLPSGLNATTGRIGDPCIRASATLTLALPKRGLAAGADVVGELYLADISVPPAVYSELGIPTKAVFARGAILHLT